MKLNEYLIEKEFQKKNAPSDMICNPIVRGNCLPILACAKKSLGQMADYYPNMQINF